MLTRFLETHICGTRGEELDAGNRWLVCGYGLLLVSSLEAVGYRSDSTPGTDGEMPSSRAALCWFPEHYCHLSYLGATLNFNAMYISYFNAAPDVHRMHFMGSSVHMNEGDKSLISGMACAGPVTANACAVKNTSIIWPLVDKSPWHFTSREHSNCNEWFTHLVDMTDMIAKQNNFQQMRFLNKLSTG